jgi:hypothetical protein
MNIQVLARKSGQRRPAAADRLCTASGEPVKISVGVACSGRWSLGRQPFAT